MFIYIYISRADMLFAAAGLYDSPWGSGHIHVSLNTYSGQWFGAWTDFGVGDWSGCLHSNC